MQGSQNQLTGQLEIAERARLQSPKMVFTSLNKYLTKEWLDAAYSKTRKDGATGVDGQTAQDFDTEYSTNIGELLELAKSGRYQAPPVRRAYIPKDNGEKRPLGIPTFADKVLQRAVLMILEPIFEQDFLDCSYGFRPGRSAIQAGEDLREMLYAMGECYVIDVDVRKYFDSIDHSFLRTMIEQRVRDGVIKRLIGKWLSAGVYEDGVRKMQATGSPQGGVISPLLANIFMHHVLDEWFHEVVAKAVKGPIKLVRFADDFVIVAKHKSDADRIFSVLGKRFEKYSLKIHDEKTKLIHFSPKTGSTFNFLGFTYYWGKSQRGRSIPKRKTAKDRTRRMAKKIKLLCKEIRHEKIIDQCKRINKTLVGIYNYYGVSFNMRALGIIFRITQRHWYRALSSRSQTKHLNWDKFNELLKCYPLKSPYLPHSKFSS